MPFSSATPPTRTSCPARMPEVFQNLPAGHARVERWLGGLIADQPLDLHRLLPAVQPGDARRARVGAQQRHEQANGGGFARAVGAKEAKHLALFHLEGDIGNTTLAAVALGQTLDFDDRCHGVSSSWSILFVIARTLSRAEIHVFAIPCFTSWSGY